MNIRYLTGHQFDAAFLLLSDSRAILFLNELFEDVPKATRRRVRVSSPEKFKEFLAKRGRVAIESEHITAGRVLKWKRKYKNKKFVHTFGLIEELRRYKDPSELRAINRACRITKRILSKIPRMLRYGVTEREIAKNLWVHAEKSGASEMAFETIVAFGENTARPHHRPTNRKFRKGNLVQIDMGIVVADYRSDYSRVYFTGKKTPEQSKAFRALSESKSAAENILRAGVTNHALYRKALSVLKGHGYTVKDFPHALGHGVGLEIHEGVRLSTKGPEVKLKKHEIVTIEPGLYFPGKFGMRLEDTYIVR